MSNIPKSPGYNGSKFASGSYQQIINLFPIHDVYIEGFLGSGAIWKIKKPSKFNYAFEINQDVISRFFPLPAADVYNYDFLNWLLLASPFINMCTGMNLKVLMYLDPPYLKSSRKSQKNLYAFEFQENLHIKLLSLVRNINCYVVISCYDCSLYSKMLTGWNKINYQSKIRCGTATETLYYNFPSDSPKHQYDFLGSNFRERAKIKNKVGRSITKLLKLPAAERNWILSEVALKMNMGNDSC